MTDLLLTLLLLTIIECVLSVDNVLMVGILSGRLSDPTEAARAQNWGMLLAGAARIVLLLLANQLTNITEPILTIGSWGMSCKDLLLLAGAAFLIYKSTHEIYQTVELHDETQITLESGSSFGRVVTEITIMNIVFSLDSVFTAVGMSRNTLVMVTAVVASVVLLYFGSRPIIKFIEKHPSVKILALAFLTMIGFTLAAEAFHQSVPKAYLYASMGFAMVVELLQIRQTAKKVRVRLHSRPFEKP